MEMDGGLEGKSTVKHAPEVLDEAVMKLTSKRMTTGAQAIRLNRAIATQRVPEGVFGVPWAGYGRLRHQIDARSVEPATLH